MDRQQIAQALRDLLRGTTSQQQQHNEDDMSDLPPSEPTSNDESATPDTTSAANSLSMNLDHTQTNSSRADEESMPELQDAESSDEDDSDREANEVEMQAVDDDDDSSWSDEEDNDPEMPPLEPVNITQPAVTRRSNRRARVEDDEDEERDRRHPSQRIGNTNNNQTSNVTSTIPPPPQQQPPHPPLRLPRMRATINVPVIPLAHRNPSDVFQFLEHFMLNNPDPNPPQTNNGNTNDPSNNTNPNFIGGFAFTIDLGRGPAGAQQPSGPIDHSAPQPPQVEPSPAPGAGAPPEDLPAFGEFLTRLGMLGNVFGLAGEREQEDPERAKRLVDGVEEVPVGLVRRLERVSGSRDDLGATGGDSGCAVCWDRLLDAEGEGFGNGKQNEDENKKACASPDSSFGENPSTESIFEGSASPSSPSKQNQYPKIVCLPCAHVFHASCLIPWFSRPRQTTCPTCRFNIDPDNLTFSRRRNPSAPATAHNVNMAPRAMPTNPMAPQQPTADGGTIPMAIPGFGMMAMPLPMNPRQFTVPSGPNVTPRALPNDVVEQLRERLAEIGGAGIVGPIAMGGAPAQVPTPNANVPENAREQAPPDPPLPNATISQAPPATPPASATTQPLRPPSATTPDMLTQSTATPSNPNPNPPPSPNPNTLPGFVTFGFDVFITGVPGNMTGEEGEVDDMMDLDEHVSDDILPTGLGVGHGPDVENSPAGGGNAPSTPSNNVPFPLPFHGVNLGGVHGRTMDETFAQLFGRSQATGNIDVEARNEVPDPSRPAAPFPPTLANFFTGLGMPFPTGAAVLPNPVPGSPARPIPVNPPRQADENTPLNSVADSRNTSTTGNLQPVPPVSTGAGDPTEPVALAGFADFFRRIGLPSTLPVPGGQLPRPGRPHHAHPAQNPGMPPLRTPREKAPWTPPPPPGPTLRQRIEKKERDAGLRCYDVSCGVGPSDDDPFISATAVAMKRLSILPMMDSTSVATIATVCQHTFHPSCLVSAERVAIMGGDATMVGNNVAVSCSVCRGTGCVSKEDWDEGVKALS